MRPRAFTRGKYRRQGEPAQEQSRFNEAPRIHAGKGVERMKSDPPHTCFNEAPRIHAGKEPKPAEVPPTEPASMRPRAFTRGKRGAGAGRAGPIPGFNEAPRIHAGKAGRRCRACWPNTRL